MVIAALIFAVTTSVSAATDDGPGTEPKMRKTHLPPISTVTIRNSGAMSPASGEPAEQCVNFKLSYQEIRDYIGRAANFLPSLGSQEFQEQQHGTESTSRIDIKKMFLRNSHTL